MKAGNGGNRQQAEESESGTLRKECEARPKAETGQEAEGTGTSRMDVGRNGQPEKLTGSEE